MPQCGADASAVLVERYTRLFNAEASKDVTFKLSDGEEKAHRNVLAAASDVFAGMFEQDMREKKDGVIELPTVDKVSMRIFLRLLYTDRLDPSDWHDAAATKEQGSTVRVLKKKHFKISATKFQAEDAGAEYASHVLLDAGSRSFDFSIKVHGEAWLVLGIEPTSTELSDGDILFGGSGVGLRTGDGKVQSLWGRECDDYDFSSPLQPLPPNSIVTCTYDSAASTVEFFVDGERVQVPSDAASCVRPDPETRYCPAITACGPDDIFELVEMRALDCPLGSGICVASLAKKYMVNEVLSSSTQALKRRVEDAKVLRSVSTFEEILAAAICYDMSALRMAALKAAEGFEELRKMYNAKSLKPEVLHELEAIWPPPGGPGRGRKRYFALG
eukprot:TRINITY_DN81697_c0_g1_i1.p1 TRINITY_DN81697_c0_g1~~TRINITY_DN81697_c0_g1_i1.p1  ORF type:complete len:387 (-),score=60.46 TRINITY_DN81697_c0_g1_i1:204-1364(-)